jgi:signal transduction histidine kinase
MRRLGLDPRSLAGRTAIVLLVGLTSVQIAGLAIHALDRIDLQRIAQSRDVGVRLMSVYRSVVLTPPAQRDAVVRELDLADGLRVSLRTDAPYGELPPTPQPLRRQIVVSTGLVVVPQPQRPKEIVMFGDIDAGRLLVAMRLPEGGWLVLDVPLTAPRIWHSRNFLLAFVLMTLAAAFLSIWAVRRLTAPVRTLAMAAERLGRDVNAPPLPEDGPLEVATAAAAFNTMAARIRRFVQDRTFMLTAIGHDLRTPITRLKLRAEFVDDEELRRKIVKDLDELEAMVAATLAFGRDVTTDEPVTAVDLTELVRTVLDEACDMRPDLAEHIAYVGPDHMPIRARTVALKRAISNLVMNALVYGDGAIATIRPAQDGMVTLLVEDHGPGLPLSEIDRMFQPFQRIETSRNNETGGMGLGLPIARNIFRAHGGDVTLGNRATGGARATVMLPV